MNSNEDHTVNVWKYKINSRTVLTESILCVSITEICTTKTEVVLLNLFISLIAWLTTHYLDLLRNQLLGGLGCVQGLIGAWLYYRHWLGHHLSITHKMVTKEKWQDITININYNWNMNIFSNFVDIYSFLFPTIQHFNSTTFSCILSINIFL